MPVAVFNPNPRYIFSYKEVQEADENYERVIKAIRQHCASGPVPVKGSDGLDPAIALKHFTTFCKLKSAMFSTADTTLLQCLRVLERHGKWLEETKSKTTNVTQLGKIAEAKAMVKRIRHGIILCRRAIVKPRERFEKWAVKEKEALRNQAPDKLLVYQFRTFTAHTDSFANFIRLVRKTCLRLFVREDKSRSE